MNNGGFVITPVVAGAREGDRVPVLIAITTS